MTPKPPRIASSKHLSTPETLPLSELEFALTILHNAFNKWIVRCSGAICSYDLNAIEVLTLHNIHQRETQQRRIDICFMLNIEDTHTVNYALKKLSKHGLIVGSKRGKEIFYSTTDEGHNVCEQYREVRDACLIPGLNVIDGGTEILSDIALTMRTLSGLYDQAARSAASMS
ncbi:MAG: putative MarR family transcription regulator [Arenicella sp.]|jgi:predicted MarR family transcription regulator